MIINAITPIRDKITQNEKKEQCKYNKYNLKNDLFIRTTTAFKSQYNDDDKSFEHFNEWAKETNFLLKAEFLAGKTGKILGNGYEGAIYEIPGTNNWVIKKYRKTNLLPISTKEPVIQKFTNKIPDLNIGQCIAKVDIPNGTRYTNRYFILQKQDGTPLGVKSLQADIITDDLIKNHLNSLEKLAQAPNKTYEQLLDDVEYVYNQGFELDFLNPQNFLYDEKEQKIKFVDVNDEILDNCNFYGEVIFPLLDGRFAINLMNSDGREEEKEKTVELSNKIISKYFDAIEKKGVKVTEGYFFNQILFSPLFDKFLGLQKPNEKYEELVRRNILQK